MIEDDLIREVRAARDEYCRQFNYDLTAIVRDLREQQRAGGREVVHLPPRRPSKGRDITGSTGKVRGEDETTNQPAA